MTTALIDGDTIAYRAGFSVEKTRYLVTFPEYIVGEFDSAKEAEKNAGPEAMIWSRKELGTEQEALNFCDLFIDRILKKCETDKYIVFLTGGVRNYRNEQCYRAKYKGNRNQPAPSHMKAIRQHIIDTHTTFVSEDTEADDEISMYAAQYPDVIVVSNDKDLLQIPGRHYDWVKDEFRTVSKKEARMFLWQQVLSGDATDNVPGCEGIGPVKAAKLLENCKSDAEAKKVVLEKYIQVYGDDGPLYAQETYDMVHLLTGTGPRIEKVFH